MEIAKWHHCYPSRWVGVITPESMRHPAKFSSRLVARIYHHCLEEGWLKPGDSVVDPFGGVALGALEAMRCGLDWTGVELEESFVQLGNGNVSLWNSRYSGKLPGWGTARLLQGDSRNLAQVIRQANGVVSSPPYADSSVAPGGIQGRNAGLLRINEGQTYRVAISSPPYVDGCAHTGGDDRPGFLEGGTLHGVGINGVASDPRYGSTLGQLGAMPPGDYKAAISSPPFESSLSRDVVNPQARRDWARANGISNTEHVTAIDMERAGARDQTYGATEGNTGNMTGDTFWTAARQIIEQTYQILTPGAHAIWVVKAFVKNGQIVDFPGQWREVCESVGYVSLHEHHAMLTHHRATYQTIEGEMVEDRVENKSFFRRLAEKKGSPRIDWETVLCMEKPQI